MTVGKGKPGPDGLTPRARNLLATWGLDDIEGFRCSQLSFDGLLSLPNCGIVTAQEIWALAYPNEPLPQGRRGGRPLPIYNIGGIFYTPQREPEK